jgi:exodeoxyribonuclease VII large subunit
VDAADEVLDPDALTIGFARRFATYKRGDLVFRSVERLARLAAQRRARLERAAGRLSLHPIRARVSACFERLAALRFRAEQALSNRLLDKRRHLDGQAQLLASLSYQRVLQRGFALVRDEAGRTVRSVTTVSKGARVDIEVTDGRLAASVTGISEPGAQRPTARPVRIGPPEARPARSRRRDDDGQQGSLF